MLKLDNKTINFEIHKIISHLFVLLNKENDELKRVLVKQLTRENIDINDLKKICREAVIDGKMPLFSNLIREQQNKNVLYEKKENIKNKRENLDEKINNIIYKFKKCKNPLFEFFKIDDDSLKSINIIISDIDQILKEEKIKFRFFKIYKSQETIFSEIGKTQKPVGFIDVYKALFEFYI